mmetsp:Transcript_23751/g.37386  ORF Transcript_23751/g.37386 Transcript_23751/m.37386 type:complete len:197 (-) Transcript_23751:79-669(-)
MGNTTCTQMNSSVLGRTESNFPAPTAQKIINADTKVALHLQCGADANPTSVASARRRHCSLPSCSPTNTHTLPSETHHRASSHPSAGRPPRHPNSNASMPKSNYEESKSVAVYSRDFDFLVNEKFPSQLRARVDRAERNKNSKVDDSNKMMILTNEAFRSLLGSEELDKSLVSREPRTHEREFSSHLNFQCLDVWE